MKFTIALGLALLLITPQPRAETVTIAADPWPPYIHEALPGDGLAIEIIREALGRQGYEVELTLMPWARAILSVQEGKFDILPGTWYTESRSQTLMFSEPYVYNELSFIQRAGEDFQYEGLESLKGKKVGIVRDYGYGDAFYDADFERDAASDLITNIRKLVWGRIDLAIADEVVARFRMSEETPELMEEIEFVTPPYSLVGMHVAVGYSNPRHEELIKAFNRGLEEMREDGSFAAIMEDRELLH